jgi:hypothetical protein
MSGAIAFQKLGALAKPDNLRSAFARINAAAKPTDRARLTSCFATTVVVAKTLTNQPISKDKYAGAMTGVTQLVTQGQGNVQTSEIMRYLDAGFLVGISLTFRRLTGNGMNEKTGEDHHFTVFALDKETMVAAMAWENHYDLTQWFLGRKQGMFPRDQFEALMGKIEHGESDAVVKLCACFGLSQKDGMPIAKALHQDVDGWRPTSKAYAFKLPSS